MRKPHGLPIPPSTSLRVTSFSSPRRPSNNEGTDLSTRSSEDIGHVRASSSLDSERFEMKLTMDALLTGNSEPQQAYGTPLPLPAIDSFFDHNIDRLAESFTLQPVNDEVLKEYRQNMAQKTQQATTCVQSVTASVAGLEGRLERVKDRIVAASESVSRSRNRAQELSSQMEMVRERLSEVEKRREMSIRMMIIQTILMVVGYVSVFVIAVRNFVLAPVHFVQKKFEARTATAEPKKEERRPKKKSEERTSLKKMGNINLFASTGELPVLPPEVFEESPLTRGE